MEDYEDIKGSIQDILNHSNIHSFNYEINDLTHQTMLKDSIYDALSCHEPRIKNIMIKLETKENHPIYAHIEYSVLNNNSRSKVVYQFISNEGTNL